MLKIIQNARYMVLGVSVVTLGVTTVYASDLSVYQPGKTGQVTLVMMLDNSGSMGSSSLNEDFGLGSCSTTSETTTTTPTFTRAACSVTRSTYNSLSATNKTQVTNGCTATGNTGTSNSTVLYKCYSRMDRLKTGMFAALDDSSIANTVVMGAGTFANSTSGKIIATAAALGPVVSNGTGTTGQRYIIKSALAPLTATYSTPTAPAFAEAAAYLLGTTTANNIDITTDIYASYTKNGVTTYSTCGTLNGYTLPSTTNTCKTWNTGTTTRPSSTTNSSYTATIKVSTTNYSATIYTNPVSIPDPDSGFSSSISTSKNSAGTAYVSPLPAVANRASCDGQGIYFLTDGEPNGPRNDQSLVMKTALGTSSFACAPTISATTAPTYKLISGTTVARAPVLTNSGAVNSYPAWDCIGTFAQTLLGNMTEYTSTQTHNTAVKGDGATNPLYSAGATVPGAPIQTALVGFGSVFNNLNNIDPQQACQWGMRKDGAGDGSCPVTGYSSGTNGGTYGNGGFYHVLAPDDVSNSIESFINALTTFTVSPVQTGAVSIPSDSLNPTGYENFAYFRMLTPSPSATTQLVWNGNLKKYNVNGGALKDSGNTNLVLNADGTFNQGAASTAITTDLWNSTGTPDGGQTLAGGAYSQVKLPTASSSTDTSGVRTLRPIWSNFATTGTTEAETTTTSTCATQTNGTINWASCGNALLPAPNIPTPNTLTDANVTTQFTSTPLSNIAIAKRVALLNYLGYSVPVGSTSIPALQAPVTTNPLNVSGGIIHSLPVQLTYSGSLNSDGTLSATRDESVLYGSMEGALHLVAAGSGITQTSNTYGTPAVKAGSEQFVFIPKEVLDQSGNAQSLIYNNSTGVTSQAPSVAQTGSFPQTPFSGVDGQWVADSSYTISRPVSPSGTSYITANKMNVYGGMRMGGFSYYGLNLLDRLNPKLLFRIAAPATSATTDPMYGKGFDRMGQTWSTPVLANVRYNGAITRVIILGGGYDVCYESPNFALSSTSQSTSGCNSKTTAAGNAIYMVNATTGALIWSASNAQPANYPSTAQFSTNTNMKYSIVGRATTLDRDADGLIDHIYFADLGGQVFRADFDNASQRLITPATSVNTANFKVRVQRIANLANTTTPANSPRFYQAPVVSIHDQGSNTFIMVNIASGDRSSPLDVLPVANGGGDRTFSTPTVVTKPVNNVYGIIDRDFSKNLFTYDKASTATCSTSLGTGSSNNCLATADITLSQLQQNPQLVTSGSLIGKFFPYNRLTSGGSMEGWYRSLSSTSAGTDVASGTGATKTAGGLKVFEESIAITGNLLVPVYDPQGVATAPVGDCDAKVVGETDRQRFCIPYGACLNSDGTIKTSRETGTGFTSNSQTSAPTLIGSGIRGIALGPNDNGGLTVVGNTSGSGGWTPSSKLIPTRWYEKQPNPSLVR